MLKKIIFIDIDNTLKDYHQEVTLKNIEAIKNVVSRGYEVVLTSGRPADFIRKMALEVGASKYLIASNGSEVLDIVQDEIIFQSKIDSQVIHKIYEVAKNLNVTMFLNAGDKRYCNFYFTGCDEMHEANIDAILDRETVSQIVVSNPKFEVMQTLRSLIQTLPNVQIVNESAVLKGNVAVDSFDFYFIDISVNNISKGQGIIKLIDYLGVDMSETIAIGDNYNDISMAQVVDTFVAVKNAIEELKVVADIITDSCANDGVAKFLNTLD